MQEEEMIRIQLLAWRGEELGDKLDNFHGEKLDEKNEKDDIWYEQISWLPKTIWKYHEVEVLCPGQGWACEELHGEVENTGWGEQIDSKVPLCPIN